MTESISYSICLSEVIMDFDVIILHQFEPSSLSYIELFVREDILQALMFHVDLVLSPIIEMSPNLGV